MKKENSIKDYLLLHILLFFYSFCGVFSKLASGYNFLSWQFIVFYGISIFILGVYAIFWQQILKKFNLTTAFFNKAITIIWGMVLGLIIFSEPISVKMIIGSVIILIGIKIVAGKYE